MKERLVDNDVVSHSEGARVRGLQGVDSGWEDGGRGEKEDGKKSREAVVELSDGERVCGGWSWQRCPCVRATSLEVLAKFSRLKVMLETTSPVTYPRAAVTLYEGAFSSLIYNGCLIDHSHSHCLHDCIFPGLSSDFSATPPAI